MLVALVTALIAFPRLVEDTRGVPPWATKRGDVADWESAGAAWPTWAPCEEADAFSRRCEPRPPSCEETSTQGCRGHGIGNGLQTSYSKTAKGAFGRGCSIIFDEKAGSDNKFEVQKYVLRPTAIPSKIDEACVMWALTQPAPAVAASVAAAKAAAAYAKERPLVGIQLRTGWADAPRSKAAWDALQCSEFTDAHANATAEAVVLGADREIAIDARS